MSVSFGLKAIDPCDHEKNGFSAISATRGASSESSIFNHFNMSSPDRPSSLISINSPFFKVTHNISVEVDYQGESVDFSSPLTTPRNLSQWGNVC